MSTGQFPKVKPGGRPEQVKASLEKRIALMADYYAKIWGQTGLYSYRVKNPTPRSKYTP